MSRSEISRRFDEIVDFAGVEKYLDTPVKYYSSGMYMRLAFAVSAHLEPDVLIVDEVLAVGDAEFQAKCLGKMSAAAGEGRTVLFVSHNMAAVEALCDRVIVLAGGEIRCDGPTDVSLNVYRDTGIPIGAFVDLSVAAGRSPRMRPVIRSLEITDGNSRPTDTVQCGQAMTVALNYEYVRSLRAPTFAILIETSHGAPVAHLPSQITGELPNVLPHQGRVECRIPSVNLAPGTYTIRVGCIAENDQLDLIEGAAAFRVEPGDFYGTGKLPDSANGPLLLPATWASMPVLCQDFT
jgi:lipopolysaccharide transport system ATP-binding protein